jgi:hypothetical protein
MKKELLTFSTNRLHLRPIERKDFKVWQSALKGTRPSQNTYDTYNSEGLHPSFSNFLNILQGDKLRISQGVTIILPLIASMAI